MRFRNSRLRTKVTALLLSLTALWVFAAWVTLREGVNLLWVASLDSNFAEPTDPLIAELQRERRLTVIRLANPGRSQKEALDAQRIRTDKAASTVRRLASGSSVKRAASPALEHRITETLGLLSRLDTNRQTIDNGFSDRTRATLLYSEIVESVFRAYDSMATLDDKEFARKTRDLIDLNRSWETLSQEDALLAGALSAGRLSTAEQTQFTQLVGARRLNTSRAAAHLQLGDRIAFDQLVNSRRLAQVQGLEDLVMLKLRPGQRPTVSAEQWRSTAEPALAELRQTIQSSGDRLVSEAKPIATGVIIRLVLAGGLGLIAVIASVVVSITTARALVRQLEKLRGAAWELAERRLPSVVERLGHGEEVDVAAEAPPLEFGKDEIGQVGQAFNAVQETAIRTAVEQAELRRGIRDVLLSLARRSQTLVHRQLTLLDIMERREIDATELEDLFRLDHLATRMRRNAENLIVLSGSTPARGWRRSVPMVDVVRAAVAEVEDYTRVTVLPFGPEGMAGRAVGDITHLLAELIENAVSFSPPYTTVQVGGQLVASGYAVEIEDRGLGMDDDRLAEINDRISDPPEFNLSSSVQLGLYVVGRLAERYGLRVSLKRSPYGGTTAVVLIPRELVVDDGQEEPGQDGLGYHAPLAAMVTAPPEGPAARTSDQPQGGVAVLDPRPEGGDRPEGEDGPEAEDPGVSEAPAVPVELPPVPEESFTPGGLPFRVPQASLAPALRTDGPARTSPAEDEAPDEDGLRTPEEIRKIVGAYQTGTRRGRSDAARSQGADLTGDDDPGGGRPEEDD